MVSRSIFIVDDDSSFRLYLSQLLTAKGYSVSSLENGDELFEKLGCEPLPSLILLDVMLPGNDGITLIEKMRSAGIKIPVIVVSGVGLVKQVVEAMKAGASDFLTKPFEEEFFDNAIQNVLEGAPQQEISPAVFADSTGFVTANPRMRQLSQIVKRVAPADIPILITGESGVGKEVMARYAHSHSGRGDRPFVKVNCAALPADLLESELFGHERGAFTGAFTDKPGMFELAHTGTLLLDEIGEMSPLLQSKLLHVLQDGIFSRLGARKSIQVDTRIIATTNIKMAEALSTGKFREDLYFRLNVVAVELPPLRERREDIRALCAHFMTKYRDRYNKQGRELPHELLESFDRYDWPGNIRQLENLIKRFLVLPGSEALFAELAVADREVPAEAESTDQPKLFSLLEVGANAAERAERDLVRRVLQETGGNRKLAARRLNICYKALLNKLKRWAPADAAVKSEAA
jgi:DNA-binding NtrC family response regulator